MKALLFHKFKKTILWTRNTNCFTIFVHMRILGEKTIQSCEYHIVPQPGK